jgi:hypothetical protein
LKKLKTLFVQFDNELRKEEVSAFRGAVIAKVGMEEVAFHNHIGDTNLLYKTPIIQYKSILKKPCIFCMGDGVDEIHKLFGQSDMMIDIRGRKIKLNIAKLEMQYHHIEIDEKLHKYSINNWLGLNEDNFKVYVKIDSLVEKTKMLERMLIGNILSFSKGAELTIEKPITVSITNIDEEKIIRYKGLPLKAFDLKFNTNISLPNYLGLGKSVSHGFGIIETIKNKNNN